VEQATRFIGMDVHKDTIAVAVTAAGEVGKATPYGTFPNTAVALEKLVGRNGYAECTGGEAGWQGRTGVFC
jgi:transposase